MERIIQKINIILGITAHNRQLGFWGTFELLVLWKFRGELITFGQQTQPAFMRQTLHGNGPERQPEKKIDSVCLDWFTDRQAPNDCNA